MVGAMATQSDYHLVPGLEARRENYSLPMREIPKLAWALRKS